jgi:hypothetical protein
MSVLMVFFFLVQQLHALLGVLMFIQLILVDCSVITTRLISCLFHVDASYIYSRDWKHMPKSSSKVLKSVKVINIIWHFIFICPEVHLNNKYFD